MKRQCYCPRDVASGIALPDQLMASRRVLFGAAAGVLAGASLASAVSGWDEKNKAAWDEGSRPNDGIPGPYIGRVVEVAHPGSVVGDDVQEPVVGEMVQRGMRELVGCADAVEAWRRFFARGDVVGIKVNPVGAPRAISIYASVRAVIAGLRSAGVRDRDIVVFDRFRRYFIRAGYPDQLPDGVRWDASAEQYEEIQLDIKGYDPDVYVSLELADLDHHDPEDERTRRSHLSLIVSRVVDKIVNVPVLKDHRSAGVTLALKNMSHGLVNNVARSHATASTNACNTFIPAVVSMPMIRRKVVLHVLDGLKAVYQGGPGAPARCTWAYGSLLFATDPVAMDAVGRTIIDAKRSIEGLPPVAQAGRMGNPPNLSEDFDIRQPQHIPLAAAIGLGISNLKQIEHQKIALA